MTTQFVANPEIVSLQKLYCPVCGELIYAPFMEAEPPPCEHVLFLFMSEMCEFAYVASACQHIVDEATEAYEKSISRSDEETQLPEEVRSAMPPTDQVDPVRYALERLRAGEGGRRVLGLLINLEIAGVGRETVGVAIDFDPEGSEEFDIEVPFA